MNSLIIMVLTYLLCWNGDTEVRLSAAGSPSNYSECIHRLVSEDGFNPAAPRELVDAVELLRGRSTYAYLGGADTFACELGGGLTFLALGFGGGNYTVAAIMRIGGAPSEIVGPVLTFGGRRVTAVESLRVAAEHWFFALRLHDSGTGIQGEYLVLAEWKKESWKTLLDEQVGLRSMAMGECVLIGSEVKYVANPQASPPDIVITTNERRWPCDSWPETIPGVPTMRAVRFQYDSSSREYRRKSE